MQVLSRYSPPSQLDTADFCSICKVNVGSNKPEDYYIQMSTNCDQPRWVPIGSFDTFNEEEISKIVNIIKEK